MQRLRLLFDNFTIILITVVLAATIFPAKGSGVAFFDNLTTAAIALLFFMHGAKLSRSAIVSGIMHWRLHILVFAFTFIMFPIIGWAFGPVLIPLLGKPLFIGMLFLCALPGTVQSAIAFTSIAKGNIAAAVCSASASSIIGIVLTPVLLKIFLGADDAGGTASTIDAIINISAQLLLPLVVGHLMRPIICHWVDRHRSWLVYIDQSSILLVVYTAFSASVVGGLWDTVPPMTMVMLTIVCCIF